MVQLMQNSQSGFTLIELMIVIAIIGILTAIALPTYRDYVGRAQMMEGFRATDALRYDVGIIIWENKTFPTDVDVASTGYLGAAAASIKGKYIADQGVNVEAGTGVVSVKFDKGAIKGETLKMRPTINQNDASHIIEWVCETRNPAYIPSTCRRS